MDRLSNSFDEVQVFPVARIEDRKSAQWRQLQQSLRRKGHLQHLAHALESGNLVQARQAFDLLAGDEPEPGQIDITVGPLFMELGKALVSGDLAGARAAFSQLQPDTPPVRQRPQVEEAKARELVSGAEENSGTGQLDVTA